MKKLIYFACMALFFVGMVSCSAQQKEPLKEAENSLKSNLYNGDVITLKSSVDSQGVYFTLRLYLDVENPDGMDSLICADLVCSADSDVIYNAEDIAEQDDDNHIEVWFSNGNKSDGRWYIYDTFLLTDGRIHLVTDEKFTNKIHANKTLWIQVQNSDDVMDKAEYSFDISKI